VVHPPCGDWAGPGPGAVVLLGNSRWHWAELGGLDGALGASDDTADSAADRSPDWYGAVGLEPGGGVGRGAGSAGQRLVGGAMGSLGVWADGMGAGLHCFHTAPAPEPLPIPLGRWRAWAAVGEVPQGLELPAGRRLGLDQVPLGAMPPWLGIDRALVGWGAWSRQNRLNPGMAVLVADAGTALSLTRVDGEARFCGGRLAAGVALQMRALAGGTALLPPIDRGWWQDSMPGPWPLETRAAMVRGCLEAVAAAIAQAWREARDSGGPGDDCQLWLTGGDGDQLAPLLAAQGVPFTAVPNLALESLAFLALQGQQAQLQSS